ncbi:TetR family transcriptional regulator [Reticulibacter mediterranei]|uniref:TetR family transcriptional regulator n=1 Tax=Reticulibacter mediterranei TaxID=2778369 RepID=A0A8J3IUQ7_9CHLR|nr:TetR family transcriptional regulator [Reticulibacter mediterranei]GHP00999.1 TetR family transcriptional regulator [Reticulibacter mediterranei]
MGLRERKKRLVQATIEETALRLFQQHGYDQTSIQDIADVVMMSPRTFFRYFASKEDILFAPTQALMNDGIRYIQSMPPTEKPLPALTATFLYIASQYEKRKDTFMIRYQVAKETPQLASMYLYSLVSMESAICDALCSRLETATNRQDMHFLVAICMAALRVAFEIWLEQEARGDIVALVRENLERLSSLA